MISGSIVVFNNKSSELCRILDCAIKSLDKIFLIDHGTFLDLPKSYIYNPKITYIKRENQGYGKGHNVAIQLSIKDGYKYHVVLNPDIYWEGKVIENLALYMDNHSDVGQIMPKVFYPNGDLQYLCKSYPTPYDIFIREFGNKRLKSIIDFSYALKGANYEEKMEGVLLSGCFMFLRTKALETVGMFDDRFFMYFEDFDLCRRISEKFRVVYYTYEKIIHAHKADHKRSKKMMIIAMRSTISYFNKWGWLFDKRRRLCNHIIHDKYLKRNQD